MAVLDGAEYDPKKEQASDAVDVKEFFWYP